MAYARIRHVGNGDFKRTERQRNVLMGIFDKALDLNPLQYPELARKLLPTIVTSLDIEEILGLANIMIKKPKIEEMRFPHNDDLIGDGAIWISPSVQCINLDLQKTTVRLKKFIYDDIQS